MSHKLIRNLELRRQQAEQGANVQRTSASEVYRRCAKARMIETKMIVTEQLIVSNSTLLNQELNRGSTDWNKEAELIWYLLSMSKSTTHFDHTLLITFRTFIQSFIRISFTSSTILRISIRRSGGHPRLKSPRIRKAKLRLDALLPFPSMPWVKPYGRPPQLAVFSSR